MENKIEKRFTLTSSLKVEKREGSDESSRTIAGYAAIFGEWSKPIYWFREKIAPGAFDVADFSQCIFCFNHNKNSIMARTSSNTLKYSIDATGLHFEFEAPNTTAGNDLLELVRRGDISQCSFAFIVEEDKWLYASKENGLELDEREIVKFQSVHDMSAVVDPAYEGTSIDARSLEIKKENYIKKQPATAAKLESEQREREVQFLKLKFNN